MITRLFVTIFAILTCTSLIQGQETGRVEAKLDTIIQKLEVNQLTLNGVASRITPNAEVEAPKVAEAPASAAAKANIDAVQSNINYVWMILAGALVFVMQAGFAMVELGFSRAKNSINIIMKNFLDFSISAIVFMFLGFGLMFGTSAGGWIGTDSFWLSSQPGDSPLWCFWFFQVVFAGTACTIVSGAMAERTKFVGYLIYAALLAAIVYPLGGHWAWGSFGGAYGVGGEKGWLEAMGFIDFAGSTVVHGVGGAAALAAMLSLWFVHGRPDVGITLNGALGGLVGITACCANITPASAFLVGIVAGILTTVATIALERLCLDDVVGAIPVHLVNGWWGTLSVALFHENGFDPKILGVQALGTFSITAAAFVICFTIFKVVDLVIGLRASETEQIDGLDFAEHAANAYPDFHTTEQA